MATIRYDEHNRPVYELDEIEKQAGQRAAEAVRASVNSDALLQRTNSLQQSIAATLGTPGYRDTATRRNLQNQIYEFQNNLARLRVLGYDVAEALKTGHDFQRAKSDMSMVHSRFKSAEEYDNAVEDYKRSYLRSVAGAANQRGQSLLDPGIRGVDVEYMTGAYGDKWKSYTEAADFEEFAARGAAIQNPSLQAAENAGSFFGRRIGGADIGNVVTYSRDNWERIAMGEANGSTMQGRSIYKYMSEAEVKLYNYLLTKEGAGKAQEYLDELEETLNQRMGGGQAKRITGIENGVGRAAAMGLYALDAGTDQAVSGMRQYLTKENLPMSPMQYGSQMVGEQLKGFGGDMYQAAQTVGNMLPSIAVGMLNPAAGSAAMGVSSAGNAYGQALDEGYSDGQARLYGTLVGAAEGLMQYLLGGISKLGGVSTGKLLSKVSMIDNALLRIAAKLGVNIGSEIAEEELQLQLDPVLRTIILGDEYTAPTVQEMLETAVVTALSTGMLEGGGTVVSDVAEGRMYEDIYGADAKSLVEDGLDINPQNTYAKKLLEQLNGGRSLSGHQIMNLVQQNETGMVRQDMADIQGAATARLAELGETGDVHAIGAALAKQAAGETLSRAERNLIENSTYGQRVANELNAENIRSGAYDSGWAEQIGTRRINPEEYGRGIADGTDALQNGTPESVTTPPESVTESAMTPEAVDAQTPSVSFADTSPSQGEAIDRAESVPALMAREVESITGIEGMSDEQAMAFWGSEFNRVRVELMNAEARGDIEAANVYAELNRLMGEAAVQGGGNIQAIVAYLKGAMRNEGSSVLFESMGRENGAGTDVESGSLVGGTGETSAGSGAGQGARADSGGGSGGRIAAAKGLRIGLQSSVSQGISNGTDERRTLFLPVYGMNERVDAFINGDEELRAIQEDADNNGITVHFFGDLMEVKGPRGKRFFVDGYADASGEIWICFNAERTASQIYDHEKIHDAIAMDGGYAGGTFQSMWAAVQENVSPEELRAIAGRTMLEYRDAYDPKDIDKIHEEIICNAYAQMKDFGDGQFSDAVKAVRDAFLERTGERPVQLGAKGTNGPPGERYSVRPEFEGEFWTWYNATNEAQRTADGGWFRVGQTSDALKSIGVRDSDIYWRKSKVGYILQEHVEMTPKLLVQVPQIIEDPLIVMKSRTQADSITLFAELAAEKRPVMAAINLKPIPTGGMEAEFVLIASAYSRSVESARNLIKNSEILYLNADKKRTDAWLMSLGLQLPSGQPAYGSVGNISYADDGVKIQGVQYSEWVKGTDEEFDGPKLRSNFPDLTEYDRYLTAEEERRRDFEEVRFESATRHESPEAETERENQEARKAQVHEMMDRALEPVLEYSHTEEGTEDYIQALLKDPKSGRRPDRRIAERYATRIGMPVIGGHRAIPFWSWVKSAERGNYGLVIGLGNGMGEVNVLFWNKRSGTESVRSMTSEELEIVPASYVDISAAENTKSLYENEPEESERMTEEEELPFTDEDFQRWAEEAERYTSVSREEARGMDELAGRILGEEINTEEDSPLELDGVKSMLAENEENLLLMEPDKAEKVYEFAVQLAPGKGGNYNMDLSRNLDMLARNKGLKPEEQRKLRETLRKEFEEPLWKAQDERSRQIKTRVNELHKKVVEGLGIKPGSRESAAVQWYGEGVKYGKYSGLKSGETKEYTLSDLKRDFPKTWKNIVAAERYFRQVYDEYIARHNQSLEKVYPRVEQRARERVEQYLAAEAYYNRRAEIQRNKIAAVKEKLRNAERTRDASREGSEKRQNAEASIDYQRKRLELAERKAERLETRAKRIGTVCADLRNEIESGGILRNKRLNPRKDYFHHFQEMETGFAALKNIVTTPQDIDSKLSGVSENTKPKSKWAGYLQRRQGAILNADAVAGLVKYIPAAEYKITMDPVIARGRMQIKLMANATQKSRNANKFLTWYTDYINDLAGKTNPLDRVPQKLIGRKGLKMIKWLNSRVRSNAIMGNVRSAMSQFFNLPNATAYVKNPVDWFRGAWLCTENLLNRNMARQVMDRSGFLRDRYLDDEFSKFDHSVITVPKKFAGWMLTAGDKFSAQLMWCAAYEKGVRTNQKDPIQYADDITRRSTAGRGAGETPLVQTAEVTKLVAPFQVEVNNAWQLMKERGGEKDILGIFNIWLTTFLMNQVLEALIGTRVGFDPIDVILDCIRDWDDEEPTGEQIMNCFTRLGGEFLSNVPYGTQIASVLVPDEADREAVFGESDPTRFGTGNIGLNMLLEPIIRFAAGDNFAPALLSAAINIGMPYGGKQTERVIEALQEYGLMSRISLKWGEGFERTRQEGGGASYTDNGYLRFVEEGSWKNFVTAAAFGPFATEAGKAYINADSKPLSGEKTELFQELTDMGASTTVAYMAVNGVGAVLPDKIKPDGTMVYGQNGYDEDAAKDWKTVSGSKEWNTIQYIESLELEDEARELLYRELVASDGRQEDLDAMEEVMMSWPQKMEAVCKYLELYMNDDMTATEKATAIKAWADMNFSTSQAAAIVENMTFSTGWTATPESYDKLVDAGLSANSALAVTTAWGDLEPEAGKTQVSDLQKMNAIIESVKSPAEQMEALSSMLDDTNRWKLSRAANYDITAEDYVEFKNTLENYYDYDPEGSVGALSQDEVTAAIQSMAWLTITQKAVLWQIQTMGKDGKNNPFSTAIGLDVYNAYQDWKESGEEVEVKTSGAAGSSGVEPVGWTGNYPGLQLPVW